jgi:hypothetical protein
MRSRNGTVIRRRAVLQLPGETKTPPRNKASRGKIQSPSALEIGGCLLCGNIFHGPRTVRLTSGIIERPERIGKCEIENFEAVFKRGKFEDGDSYKDICPLCSYEHDIIAEDVFDWTETLESLDMGWCCICHQPIEPWPDPDYASAVMIERGIVKKNPNYDPRAPEEIYVGRSNILVRNPNADPLVFDSHAGGTVHYLCMDDLGIELWSLIERTDEPDFSWPG